MKPERIQIYEGSEIHLNCIATGNPKPTITWQRVLGKMPSSNKIMPNGTFYLNRVRKEHSGMYQCKAMNAVGTSTAIAIILVQGNVMIYERSLLQGKGVEWGQGLLWNFES